VPVASSVPEPPRPVDSADSAAEAAEPPAPSVGVPSDSLQAVVVATETWKDYTGSLQRFERESPKSAWSKVGEPNDVVVGRYGMAWGRGLHPSVVSSLQKVERDLRSPAGIFDLGEARGYASSPPDGTSWPYQSSGPSWRCVDQPYSPAYNSFAPTDSLFADPAAKVPGAIRRETVFELLVFVKHNTDPVVRGAGSCILLHVWSSPGSPTHGCTAMQVEHLKTLVAWLKPQNHPVLVQAPIEAIEEHGIEWGIPR